MRGENIGVLLCFAIKGIKSSFYQFILFKLLIFILFIILICKVNNKNYWEHIHTSPQYSKSIAVRKKLDFSVKQKLKEVLCIRSI